MHMAITPATTWRATASAANMVGAGLLAPAPVAPERKVRNAKSWAQRVANEEAGGRRE